VPRLYDTNGRNLLAELCTGVGLDVGCNEQKVTPNCIGVDIDPSVSPDVIADMAQLCWPDNHFDFVVSSHVLEHAYDVPNTLSEWRRVVKPGGVVGIVVPHGEHVCSETLGDANCGHRHLFTHKTLALFLQHVGFVDVESQLYERPYAYKQTPGVFAKGYVP